MLGGVRKKSRKPKGLNRPGARAVPSDVWSHMDTSHRNIVDAAVCQFDRNMSVHPDKGVSLSVLASLSALARISPSTTSTPKFCIDQGKAFKELLAFVETVRTVQAALASEFAVVASHLQAQTPLQFQPNQLSVLAQAVQALDMGRACPSLAMEDAPAPDEAM